MADDFIVFLVAGLIIIAILIAGFMTYPWIPEDKCCPTRDILDFEGALIVGPKDISTYRPYELGYFNADFESGTNVYALGNRVVKNGVLFGNMDFRYHIEAMHVEDVNIKFSVVDTNNYGPLIIKMNGQVIDKRDFAIGEYTIVVPRQMLVDEIFIELYAENSGLKVWAPTYYELADIRVVVVGYAQNSFAYAFATIEEYSMFNEARIELSLDENVGEITIVLNDREVYSGPVLNTQSFRFDKSYLRYGQNYLYIMAKENSVFKGYAKMLIFYNTVHDARLEIPFSINKTVYDKMKAGTITFDVVQVLKGGGVSVKIVSNNQVTYNAYGALGIGNYAFTFDKPSVRLGENLLIIDSVDNGIFAVKNVAVKV